MDTDNGVDQDRIRAGLSAAKGVKTNHAVSRLMVYREEIDAAIQRGVSVRQIHAMLVEGGEELPSLSNFYVSFRKFLKLNPRIGTGTRVASGSAGRSISDSLKDSVSR